MMESAHDADPGRPTCRSSRSASRISSCRSSTGRKKGGILTLETSITGTVSLEAELKGINMSRIMRSFYDHKDKIMTGERMGRILQAYLRNVKSKDARLKLVFSYPMLQTSLRSGLEGYQFYRVAFEGVMTRDGRYRRFIHFDFVYSSACPCSAELAEHARDARGAYGVPHSQRSKARVILEEAEGRKIWIEDVHAHCLQRPADRDAGHGEARGRAGLRRAERRPPQVRRGRGAAPLPRIRRATRGSGTSRSPARTWSRCTRTTRSA